MATLLQHYKFLNKGWIKPRQAFMVFDTRIIAVSRQLLARFLLQSVASGGYIARSY